VATQESWQPWLTPGSVDGAAHRFSRDSCPGFRSRRDFLSLCRLFKGCSVEAASPAGGGDGIIGAPCRISDRRLCTDSGPGGLHAVAEFLLAEISYAPFPVTSRPDLMVIAIVLPVAGEGIMGTQLGGADVAGRDCWFVLSPGGQHLDALDTMGALGSVRCDLSEAYQPSSEGDGILGEGAYATVRCMQRATARPSL